MKKKFHKMEGCGNDFIIMNFLELNKIQRKFICDRKYGIGCDQLILLKYPKNTANYDCEIIIYNSDGSQTSFCGNGLRCVAKLLFSSHEFLDKKTLKIKSSDKITETYMSNDLISVNIGQPKLSWNEIPLSSSSILNNNLIEITQHKNIIGDGFCINVGNPHIVFFVKNFNFDYEQIGKEVENMGIFPEKINVNFAQIINNHEILLQTYERGSGLTLACGSGSCATFFAAAKQNLIPNHEIKIKFLKSARNDFLNISLNQNNEIIMSGPANYVFEGETKIPKNL